MGLNNLIVQKILGKTLFLNSIILIKKNFFFLVFSSYVIFAKIFSKNFFSEISDFKILGRRKKVSRIKLNTVLETKTKKNLGFINCLFSFGSKNFEFLIMQTKKKQIFFFPFFQDHSNFFSLRQILLIQGTKNLGINTFDCFRDFFCYSATTNSVQIEQIFTFPYLFYRKLKIICGLSHITKVKFYPLGLVYSTISEGSYFILTKKKKKFSHFSFLQIGKLVRNNFFQISLNSVFSTADIFIATLTFNKLETFRLSFDEEKKFVSIQLCGSNETITCGNLTALIWSGIFSKNLLTGDNFGKISLWNELLFPLLEIKNFSQSIRDLKNYNDFSSFIIIIKKEKTTYEETGKNKFFKNIPKTTIKLFAFKKKNPDTFKVIVNLINLKNRIPWVKNFLKSENWKKNNLNKIKILTKIGELILVYSYFEKKFSYYTCYFFFFSFQKILKFFLSESLKINGWLNFSRGKIFFFRFSILSKIRKLSLRELKHEQKYIMNFKKNYFFFTCAICNRIFKFFVENSLGKIICFFYHLQKNKYSGWTKEKEFYTKRKVYHLWDFEKKKIIFPYSFKIISFSDLKAKSIQKEFSQFGKFK